MRRALNDSDELLDDFMYGKSSNIQFVQDLEPQRITPGMPTLSEVHKSVAVAVEHLLGAEVKISVLTLPVVTHACNRKCLIVPLNPTDRISIIYYQITSDNRNGYLYLYSQQIYVITTGPK